MNAVPTILQSHKISIVPKYECPLVHADTKYSGRGVVRKLHSTSRFIDVCNKEKILIWKDRKPREGERAPYTAKSLANLIAMQWECNPEEILFRGNPLEDERIKCKGDSEKIQTLHRIFSGATWYDYLTKRQEKIRDKGRKIGKVLQKSENGI